MLLKQLIKVILLVFLLQQSLYSQNCSLTSTGFSNLQCHDNGTPDDANDDYLEFSANPQGANLSAGYKVLSDVVLAPVTLSNGDPAFNIPYGSTVFFRLPNGSSNESGRVIFIDQNNNTCFIQEDIVGPGSCSVNAPPACDLTTAGLSNIQCNDNGTPANNDDDYMVFSLHPQGSGLGTAYFILTISNISPILLLDGSAANAIPYNTTTFFRTPPGTADQNVVLSINDQNNSGTCSFLQSISPTGNCSPPPCNLSSSGFSGLQCNDNGTPGDANDDYVEFQANPQGSNLGSGYKVLSDAVLAPVTLLDGAPAINIPYGSTTFFRLPNGSSDESGRVLFIDQDNNACFVQQNIVGAGSCSVNAPPACSIVITGLNDLTCHDNGTPDNEDDDYMVFSLNPQGNGLGTGYFILTVSNIAPILLLDGNPASAVPYNTATFFRTPPGTADQNVVLSINDQNNSSTCSLVQSINPTGNCSNNNPSPCSGAPPLVAACRNIEVNLDLTGSLTVLSGDLDNGSTGCGLLQFAVEGQPSVSFQCSQIGANNVVLTVIDSQGATSTCSAVVQVSDMLPPVMTCPGNVSAAPAQTVNCTALVSNIAASATDNCGTVSIGFALTGATVSTGSGQASGQTFNAGSTTVTYTATDGNGRTASCQFVVNVPPCGNGRIIWKQDNTTGVKDVTVALTGDQNATSTTGANGIYGFALSTGGNFAITPTKNLNKLNGVNASDVFRLQQHLSGNPLTDPYLLVAADVNSNNVINALDVNIIQLSLLGNPAALAQMVKSWRFVPTSHVMTNPPFGFPESINLTGVNNNQVNKDFFGIKVGDVAAAFANPANLIAAPALVFAVPDKVLQAGEHVEVVFHAGQIEDLAAFQFGLHFDPDYLQLVDIKPLTALPMTQDNFGRYNLDQGKLNILWAGNTGVSIPEAAPLFHLTFKILANGGQLSEVLNLDENELPGRAYTGNLTESPVRIQYFESSSATGPALETPRLRLLQNQPNPFSGRTQIGFELPVACSAQLHIFDAAGRVLALRDKQYTPGLHREIFELEGAPGVLYYQLTTPFGVLSQKMVLLAK